MPARKAAQPNGPEPTPSKPTATGSRPARRRSPRPTRAGAAAPQNETLSPPSIDEDGSWVEADAVEVHQGAVGRVDAADVRVSQGVVGAARADRISIEMGGLGAAMGGEVSITQGGAGSILGQRVTIDQAVVRTLVAQEVEFRGPGAALVLIAQRVSGDVRVLLDWRAGLAFGVAFGLVSGLVRRRRRAG